MGMHDIKIMFFDVFHRFREMIVSFKMSLPGNTSSNERTREKRNEMCRGSGIARREYRHVMSLCYLFFDEVIQHNLRSTIVLWRKSNPRRGDVRDFHRYPLRA